MSTAQIVLVDDDPDVRAFLGELLTGAGYQVKEASDAPSLMRVLGAEPPDLFLVDVMMSWLDGFGLCRSLKQNPSLRDVPVWLISGRTDAGSVKRGLGCGAGEYFTKPIDTDHLLRRLDRLLRQGGGGAP